MEGVSRSPLNTSTRAILQRLGILFAEKIPFFIVASLVSSLTIAAQKDLRAISSLDVLPLSTRIQNVIVAYCLYLRKMLWPADLAPIYPLQRHWLWWQVIGCGLFLACTTYVCVRFATKRPYFLFGWCWYLGTLIPVIGLVQAGSQGLADRYTYISLIGVFIMGIWGIVEAAERIFGPHTAVLIGTQTCALLVLLAASTCWQTRYWKNSIRLFEHAVHATKNNPLAFFNLGLAFEAVGNAAESEYNFREAIRIRPGLATAHATLGEVLFKKGDLEGALEEHDIALRINPDDPENHASLANLYENAPLPRFRDPARAVEHARRACELTHFRQRRFLVLLAGTCVLNHQYGEAAEAAQKVQAMSVSALELQDANNLIAKICELQSKGGRK
jgi:tetratricopeptide (TPR) repeat protein